MAYQYLVIGPGPKTVQGSNTLADVLQYQYLQGYTVIDATNQNVLDQNFQGSPPGQSNFVNRAIPALSMPAPSH